MGDQNSMDLVFHALAHPTRRHMMDLVKESPGCSVNDLCQHFETSRISVMKHLQVLVDANLILSKKSGRTRELFFNVAPIQMIHDRWSDEYSEFWVTRMIDLKYKIEGQSNEGPGTKQTTAKKATAKKGKSQPPKTKKSTTKNSRKKKSVAKHSTEKTNTKSPRNSSKKEKR